MSGDPVADYAWEELVRATTPVPDPPADDTPPIGDIVELRAPGAEPPASKMMPGISFADIKPRLDDDYIVKGLIGRETLVADVGPSGCGKTFFICDLAMHIASGLSWRGHRVKQRLVVMVELEGARSAENRLYAANEHNPQFGDRIALKLTPGPLNLRDLLDVQRLIAFIRAAEQEHGLPIGVCIIDTLSRAMAGGDENGPEDMGALIRGADMVRTLTGATVILVHHTGKDESRGGRGHSSLFAALDTEIVVSQTGSVRIATVTKQRDLPSGGRYAFALDVVELGHDSEGDPVTTCIVRAADAPPPDRKPPGGKNQAALLAALQEWMRARPDTDLISSIDFRAVAKAQGLTPKRLAEVTEGLVKSGWLTNTVGGYRLPENPS